MTALRFRILALLASLPAAFSAAAPGPGFASEPTGDTLKLTFRGEPLADYVFRDERTLRPYFARLHGPGGVPLTRNHPPVAGTDAVDHAALHPGLWLAFGDLGGVDFWRKRGRIEFVRFAAEPSVAAGRLGFAVEENWLGPDGTVVAHGTNEFLWLDGATLTPALPGPVLLWRATLRGAERPLVFSAQHEGGLGLRVATPLIVTGGSGRITGSHGGADEAGNWGRPGQWWNYAGTVAGRAAGVLLVAGRDSDRPVWTHARNYGFIGLNPNGPPAQPRDDLPPVAFSVPAGQALRLSFGVLLHTRPAGAAFDAAAAAGAIDATLRAWPAAPPRPPAPVAVPTFESMGLYWDAPETPSADLRCAVRFRAAGETAWRDAQPLWLDRTRRQFRGSVVHLQPGTTYDFALTRSDGAATQLAARTWPETFPVAARVTLPAGTRREPLVITEGGSPAGYRVYEAAPEGTTIDVGDAHDTCLRIDADYVIVRGVVARGARIHGIVVDNRRHVVVEGCDISGWGRRDPAAGTVARYGTRDVAIRPDLGFHLDAGIRVEGPDAERVVIQGNRIHHPRYTANNWTQASPYFSNPRRLSTHPQGPKAVVFAPITRGRHVLRWNTVESDFARMFNDALLEAEPAGNGFGGDGDIHGNRISHCWDDGIEAERGDRNVRVWGNHFSSMIKAVSAGYIWSGPLYVWRNVAERMLHPNTMPGHNGGLSPFAAHPPCFLPPPQEDPAERRDGVVFVFHNTLLADADHAAGWAFNAWHRHRYVSDSVRLVSRNNVWMTRAYPAYWNTPNPAGTNFAIRDLARSYLDQDHDLHDGEIAPPDAAGAHTLRAGPRFRPGGLKLVPGTPGHDDAVRLANFNDAFLDRAPDRGAIETGAPDPEYGVALWRRSLAAPPQTPP